MSCFVSYTSIFVCAQYTCKEEMMYNLLGCFTFSVHLMTRIAKIIEIVGSSDKSWQDAAQAALNEAKKTIHEITGVEIGDMTAKVDPNTGNITEYHTAVKIAFGVEH
jgi:dodecin